jgi:hypothetical protein
MKEAKIPLSRNLYAVIDEQDASKVLPIRWHINAHPHTVYARSSNPRTYLHRFVMNAQKGQFVDHINGDGLDNRRANLRIVTPSQNIMNRNAANAKREYKGITFSKVKGLWVAQIKKDGKGKFIGHFDDPVDAAIAYDLAALTLFGEFANTNFPRRVLERIK